MPEQLDSIPCSEAKLAAEMELATLAEIGSAIVQAQLDEDKLCELIRDLAGRIVPTSNFQIGLFEGVRYRIKVWIRDGEPQPETAFILPDGQGIIGWLRTSKQPLVVRDFLTEIDRKSVV